MKFAYHCLYFFIFYDFPQFQNRDVYNFRVNKNLYWVLTYDVCFFSCSCDGWIWAKNRGSLSWHTSCLQRIFSEAGMFCFRKVSVTHNHHIVSLGRILKKIQKAQCDLVWVASAVLCLQFPGGKPMEIHSLVRLKSTTPLGIWKFHIFSQRMPVCTSVLLRTAKEEVLPVESSYFKVRVISQKNYFVTFTVLFHVCFIFLIFKMKTGCGQKVVPVGQSDPTFFLLICIF